MARKRFNPDDIKGPSLDFSRPRREAAKFATVTDATPLTVSQVADLIKRTLEERIASPIRVVGEVSNLSIRSHWYFSLKDEQCVINCVAWASSARKFGFTPRTGDEIVATGHVSHYGPQGQTQLYVSKVEPIGAGALDLRFRAMCEELRALGYFDDSRKRPVPVFPRRIAVITSATGAALRDVIATAAQRCPAVALLLVDVRVQGEGAGEAVARAVRIVNRRREALGVDVILITRGGGSIEDLWTFNERIVADAVLRSELPVVAAIGHESDVTIAELVADLRAATPTQAAMRLMPDRADLARHIGHLRNRLDTLLARRLEREKERLIRSNRSLPASIRSRMAHEHLRIERFARAIELQRPAAVERRRRERLAVLGDRLRSAVHRNVARGRDAALLKARFAAAVRDHLNDRSRRLDGLADLLEAVSVGSVLRRGFSYATRTDGEIVRSVADVFGGEVMLTHLSDGSIRSRVEGEGGKRTRKKNDGSEIDQLDLFRNLR